MSELGECIMNIHILYQILLEKGADISSNDKDKTTAQLCRITPLIRNLGEHLKYQIKTTNPYYPFSRNLEIEWNPH
jgi:hypothetical protein